MKTILVQLSFMNLHLKLIKLIIFFMKMLQSLNLAGDYNKAKNYFDRVIDGFKPLNGKSEFQRFNANQTK